LIVEHVDFWAVPVTDMERSITFYRDTLGLPQTGDGGFPEFKLGDNGFLYRKSAGLAPPLRSARVMSTAT
jgi:catechol 2,3-dioxygenase-like lactoylglutathione lyase family enzyme